MAAGEMIRAEFTPEQADELFRLVDERPELLERHLRVGLRAVLLAARHREPQQEEQTD